MAKKKKPSKALKGAGKKSKGKKADGGKKSSKKTKKAVVKKSAHKAAKVSKPKKAKVTKSASKKSHKPVISKKVAKKSGKLLKKLVKKVLSKSSNGTSKPLKSKPVSKLSISSKGNSPKQIAASAKKPGGNSLNGKSNLKSSGPVTVKSISAPAGKAADKKTETPAKQIAPAATRPGAIQRKSGIPSRPQLPISKESPEERLKKLAVTGLKKIPAEKRTGVLAISNTIPVKAKNEISPSKIASISYSITNPVRKTDSYAVRPEKEPAGKFEMEFVVHASAEMLYEFLSTPSGLSEWFCDDLNIRNGIYTFIWDDQLQQARLLKTVDQQMVRFQWVDKNDGSYFEFRIQRDDLTNDISLIITDFAETSAERESSKLLWHSQVEKLMHVIGSIF